jgi:hypothetical protein
MPKPPRPSSQLIRRSLCRWEKLKNYKWQEKSLELLFRRFCPRNRKLADVLLKVSALNDFYSTNIFNTYAVAKHIQRCNVDIRLARGEPSLVNDIARLKIKKREINFYSFATKYCSHHQPVDFPVFDYFVERMLMHYKKKNRFSVFAKADLKDYERLIEVIAEFRMFYGLGRFSLRKIDIFLWLAGKKYFPRKHKRRKEVKRGISAKQQTD